MKICFLSFDPVSYFSGIVSEHCCVPEGICEWQLYLQHLMGVQIQSQSDLGVTRICPVKQHISFIRRSFACEGYKENELEVHWYPIINNKI